MNRKSLLRSLAGLLIFAALAPCDSAVLVNVATAKWTHEKGDEPGAESAILREDPQTGALEMMVRYGAGHVFKAHWHSNNERILLIEGRLALKQESGQTVLEPGGFAFLPAKEVQRMSCVSTTRCTFYLYWDGKPDFNVVK